MPSRYLFQDLQDLKDLPDFIESHFKEVKKEITGLKNKLEEIEAIEKYYERNFLFELRTNTRQKKKEIQQKLYNILTNEIWDGTEKFDLHLKISKIIKDGVQSVSEALDKK
jgi:hypothetical protein